MRLTVAPEPKNTPLSPSEFADEPLPCEFADIGVTWTDPRDHACDGSGSWLLVGPDLPSPLCGKHARLVAERISLAAYDLKLVRA